MNTKVERMLTGAFRATHLGADAWQLTTGTPAPAEIYLTGVDSDAFAVLDSAAPSAVCVGWSAAGAVVTLVAPGARTQFRSRTATIHEPRPQLYQGLPLVVLDDKARRFWRRAFRIARIPGGRRLLRWIAQRKGGG
ncbi:MAG: hypothetical protein ABSG30_10390 [Steroidobacteraceae bacterium]|jgi:hypothetical protein